MTENNINLIYDKLLKTYSYQGWWPIIGYDGSNPTKTGAVKGYHPKDYSFPRNSKEQFEIIVPARAFATRDEHFMAFSRKSIK